SQSDNSVAQAFGRGLLWFAPLLMKLLSIAGTAAMFLVGGGILVHGLPAVEHWIHNLIALGDNGLISAIGPTLGNALVGIVAGGLAVLLLTVGRRLFGFGQTVAH
ncbi:MAG: DUF808 family protein, partial [Burkholderiaceae bacterium]